MEIQDLDILLRLVAAHLLADFVFQTNAIVAGKHQGLRSWHFFVHILTVGVLTYLFLANWSNWAAPLIIMLIHGVIDLGKIRLQKDNLWVYVTDQVLHVATLFFFWLALTDNSLRELAVAAAGHLTSDAALFIAIAYITVTLPMGVLIGYMTSKWQREIGMEKKESLKNAGKWIGILERLLILTFILMNDWRPIGFLLAAKSVFRFGDLKEGADRKKTEYILIGTLLSFTLSILFGIFTSYLLRSI